MALALDTYDSCIAHIDEHLGRLYDELARRGVLERTWVIIASDHGESFGEHEGVYVHGSSLYRTELHVPLVVVPPPGIRIKPVVAETASLRDMAATMVDIAGWGTECTFQGESLARLWRPSSDLRGPEGRGGRAMAELIPNETLIPGVAGPPRRPGPLASLTEDGWSYIRREGDAREELYHVQADPGEKDNVAAASGSRPRLERMRDALSRLTLGPLTHERFNP